MREGGRRDVGFKKNATLTLYRVKKVFSFKF